MKKDLFYTEQESACVAFTPRTYFCPLEPHEVSLTPL